MNSVIVPGDLVALDTPWKSARLYEDQECLRFTMDRHEIEGIESAFVVAVCEESNRRMADDDLGSTAFIMYRGGSGWLPTYRLKCL